MHLSDLLQSGPVPSVVQTPFWYKRNKYHITSDSDGFLRITDVTGILAAIILPDGSSANLYALNASIYKQMDVHNFCIEYCIAQQNKHTPLSNWFARRRNVDSPEVELVALCYIFMTEMDPGITRKK